VHFPDRVFTWSSLLPNYLLDIAYVFAIAWVMSRIGRERFSSYGLPLVPGAGKLLARGAVWGFIPSALILIPIWLAGGCEFHGLALHGRELIFYAFAWAAAMLALGFAEEFLFRGYALKTLGEAVGFWPAAVALSSLFGLVHLIFKPHEDWIDPVSVALYGLFWCLTLRRTGSLWFAVGFHAASDYADMIVFAEPNTGNDGHPIPGHLLDVSFHGPEWLTGGPRGTEASLLVFVVLAGLFYFFHRAYPAKKAGTIAQTIAGQNV
jgi:membrane protease YdiL (CAAX protease family)